MVSLEHLSTDVAVLQSDLNEAEVSTLEYRWASLTLYVVEQAFGPRRLLSFYVS